MTDIPGRPGSLQRDGGSALATELIAAACCWLSFAASACAVEVVMKDGRVLSGKIAEIGSLTDSPGAPHGDGLAPLLIVLIDDDLRRIFVPQRQIAQVNPGQATSDERFTIRQRVARSGLAVRAVGPVMPIQPFDEYGRRTFTFNTLKGPVDVIQGITELTPQWAKVEGISHVWDMRIATSSIPRDTLYKILLKQIDPDNVDHQKKLARFYLQAERYEEAADQLEYILKKFPNEAELRQQLEPTIRSLHELSARRLIGELKLRSEAGQHQFVQEKLKSFPSEGVSGETLQSVQELIQQYEALDARRRETLQMLDTEVAMMADAALRGRVEPIREEITQQLDYDTLDRMQGFRNNLADTTLLPADKVALAISGWLMGTDAAITKLSAALSAYKVRGLVREYLAEPVKVDRETLLQSFASEEGGTPAMVAAILAGMKPPLPPPEPIDAQRQPGYYKLVTAGLEKDTPLTYYVQLPPEYNPYRRYPTIVTLNGGFTTPPQQIDWWAGAWNDGWRAGQAWRHGYIVIAPEWTVEHQRQYNYSPREHAAVTNALRDACRHFSVDSDRVYLTGHALGGDAAWDIGLAHPDLWAGVIPITAQSDRFVRKYWENAKRLPLYFVGGELDPGKLAKNTIDLDRYLKQGYNCTVVEYQGRGHEHFYEEILRLFDWMSRLRRNPFPREIAAGTMRESDHSFWWLELSGMPPRVMVAPGDALPGNVQPLKVTGTINRANGVNVVCGASAVTVGLSPKMLDFEQHVSITVNGRRVNSTDRLVRPDLKTLLEDVRVRADRQNPFWAKVQAPTGRVAGK